MGVEDKQTGEDDVKDTQYDEEKRFDAPAGGRLRLAGVYVLTSSFVNVFFIF